MSLTGSWQVSHRAGRHNLGSFPLPLQAGGFSAVPTDGM